MLHNTTLTNTGCYLDASRGHHITRDIVWLAQGYGFIVDGLAQFALNMYENHCHYEDYPVEELQSLCDEAVEWLNSGQCGCDTCGQTGKVVDGDDALVICRACSGTKRGDRVKGQNFPPIIPAGTFWAFNDDDFGIWHDSDLCD